MKVLKDYVNEKFDGWFDEKKPEKCWSEELSNEELNFGMLGDFQDYVNKIICDHLHEGESALLSKQQIENQMKLEKLHKIGIK